MLYICNSTVRFVRAWMYLKLNTDAEKINMKYIRKMQICFLFINERLFVGILGIILFYRVFTPFLNRTFNLLRGVFKRHNGKTVNG